MTEKEVMAQPTLIDQAAEELFRILADGGAIARITDRYCTPLETDEAIRKSLGHYLQGFLLAHWPDVQLVEQQRRMR